MQSESDSNPGTPMAMVEHSVFQQHDSSASSMYGHSRFDRGSPGWQNDQIHFICENYQLSLLQFRSESYRNEFSNRKIPIFGTGIRKIPIFGTGIRNRNSDLIGNRNRNRQFGSELGTRTVGTRTTGTRNFGTRNVPVSEGSDLGNRHYLNLQIYLVIQ